MAFCRLIYVYTAASFSARLYETTTGSNKLRRVPNAAASIVVSCTRKFDRSLIQAELYWLDVPGSVDRRLETQHDHD